MTRAVVLGGGFAGVLAAAVLTGHVDEVVLVEAGQYPATPTPRPGLPQAHHSHILVSGGAQALETLLPGTLAALYEQGAHRRGLPSGALILTAEGWFRRRETDAYLISATRWLLDHVIRQRVLGDGRIDLRERTRALGLAGDGSRITGAVVRRPDDRVETVAADLVIDATGRGSQAPRWLADLGGPAIVEETVDPGLAYATRVYQAPVEKAAIPAVMLHPAAVSPACGATLFPIEDGHWIVTLTGTRGGEPATDEQGFTAFAENLRCGLIADLMAVAEPLGDVRAFHGTVNRRRYFEQAALPDGFLVLGDGTVAVNPVHSHGMSIAALSALRLAGELAERGADPSATPKLQAAIAEVAERSWRMATAQDRQHAEPETFVAPQPSRVAMTRRMLGSAPLMAEFFRAQTLMSAAAPPLSNADLFAELSQNPEPLLTAAEAVAQFPDLRRTGSEP